MGTCGSKQQQQLKFRIVAAVHEEDVDDYLEKALRESVEVALKNCGMTMDSAHIPQIKETEEADNPEIEELALEVEASSASTGDVRDEYNKFLLKWRDEINRRDEENPLFEIYGTDAYVEIYGNDFFTSHGSCHHKINYESIRFGVLPHDGSFCQFAKLDMQKRPLKTLDFYHDTRSVLIHYGDFEITFSYDTIRNVYMNIGSPSKSNSGDEQRVYFDLSDPPIIKRVESHPHPMKYRNLNMCHPHRNGFGRPNAGIDVDVLGRCNILCLTSKSDALEAIVSNIHHKCAGKSVYFSDITTVEYKKPKDPKVPDMDFECAYLLTALFERNFTAVMQAEDIDRTLEELRSLDAASLERALTDVLRALDSGKIVDYWRALLRQYEHYAARRSDEADFRACIVPPSCCEVRRVTVTPTRRLLWPKEVMYGNRVLRNFDSDYALRVSLRDDDMSPLSSRSDPGVLESCTGMLRGWGLLVASRKYEFLGWSNSQLRDHGVWMYARDEKGNTSAHIRQWMGDFSHIRNVPKYMARMGQCFSQTEDTIGVPLDPELVRTEPDIEDGWDKANGKPYCFSDGLGRMSTELAAKVHRALGRDQLCSAFQIRYGGFKGMLVIDPTLTDTKIVFRNSMKKFDCPNSTQLEIAKTSAPIPLKLNRPFITLLNGLGVPDSAFLRLQEKVLQKLTTVLYDEEEAATFLQDRTPFDVSHIYRELAASGIHLTTEPFFKSILLTLHRHCIEKIKDKANIPIDPDKGRNMIGVMDEYGKLSYGQVFVQYTKDISYGATTRDTVIVTGQVLVTKNPCMHPGDVRKFQAVDVPELHHVVDCIVFPRKGRRPHPTEMAGSDLDGDEYAVLWCPELIFEGPNRKAADFPARHSESVRRITVDDMIEFLQNYIRNDQVGQIANAHLAHADREGIDSEVCLSIAKKFSVAVDFAKNGRAEQLDRWEKPDQYPDFMEKYSRKVYHSQKALGSIYRICKDFESENQAVSITYKDVKVDPDLVYTGWEEYEDSAIESKNKYSALLGSFLRKYGIEHEAEAMSGTFSNLHERKDRYEIERVIVECMKRLNKCMWEEFNQEFQTSSNFKNIQQKIFQKASAWYVVTYSDPNAKFLSFPWIVSKHLVNIKSLLTLAKPLALPPAIVSLDTTIDDWELRNLLPEYIETNIWNQYSFACSRQIVERALRTLISWATEADILEQEGSDKGRMFLSVFVKLFFHVAEKFGYVSSTTIVRDSPRHFSAGLLCIEFLKYCSNFRFYSEEEITSLLKFPLYKHDVLAKRAMVYFHNFALTGKLQSLNVDKKMDDGLIDMKPVVVESKILAKSPIDRESLQKAKAILIKRSKVQSLNLRENLQTQKIYVSATGTELAIKELKTILGKEPEVLHRLFSSGVMSEKKWPVPFNFSGRHRKKKRFELPYGREKLPKQTKHTF